jgi:hypothetical protein
MLIYVIEVFFSWNLPGVTLFESGKFTTVVSEMSETYLLRAMPKKTGKS